MSLYSNGFAQISPGETLVGKDPDLDQLNYVELEGLEAAFIHTEISPSNPSGIHGGTGRRTIMRICRNQSGGVLKGGELGKLDLSQGFRGLGRIGGKSTLGARHCVIVDPLLGENGVADGDLFLAAISGPTHVLVGTGGLALTEGDTLAAGASGRPAKGATTAGASQLIMGTFLASGTTGETENKMVAVDLHPSW